jgi:hypothetical protein
MMRFRCPHCQQVLEVVTPTEMFLCPACELWCRIPLPQEFKPSKEETRPSAEPSFGLAEEPRLAPSNPEPIPSVRSHAITSRRPEAELPLRFRDEPNEVDSVTFEIIEEGGERRRKRRRRRRRSRFTFNLDYWISPSLILLILLVPAGIFLTVISFLYHPGAGFGALLMVGGSIWLAFIAAEDGLATALMVLFVPFYPWYFAFTNFERVAVPFVLRCLGAIIFVVTLVSLHLHVIERSSALPPSLGEPTRSIRPITFCRVPRAAAAVFRPQALCQSLCLEAPEVVRVEELLASLPPTPMATDR